VVIYTDGEFLTRKVFDNFKEADDYQDNLNGPSYFIYCPNGTRFDFCGGKIN
jgi:hypothetical protein